jgi:hypothetical protein
MSTRPHRRTSASRFACWLWLALLFPVAQVAAAAHELSHVRAEAGDGVDGKQAAHLAHCDLCPVAAAILAAPPAADRVPASDDLHAAHGLPRRPDAGMGITPPAAYLSRAPPPASH